MTLIIFYVFTDTSASKCTDFFIPTEILKPGRPRKACINLRVSVSLLQLFFLVQRVSYVYTRLMILPENASISLRKCASWSNPSLFAQTPLQLLLCVCSILSCIFAVPRYINPSFTSGFIYTFVSQQLNPAKTHVSLNIQEMFQMSLQVAPLIAQGSKTSEADALAEVNFRKSRYHKV